MLPMRCAWVFAAGCLVALTPARAASGQLILSCKGQETAIAGKGADRTVDDAVLIFDFDRWLVFHNGAAGGTPIRTMKRALITWKSDDGTRAGYLNRATLQAGENDATVRATYACRVYAQLQFNEGPP